jgi:two-component system sensor histidine kinase KdpD
LLLRLIGVLALVAAVTTVDFGLLHANSPTAAFSYLLLILVLATRAGMKESILASVASMLTYNYFFLPPIGTLTVADPQNWVALFVFLVTAITASHLSASARRKAEEALKREHELQRMYDFSRALMLGHSSEDLVAKVPQHIRELFDIQEVGLYDRDSDKISFVSSAHLDDEILREVANTGVAFSRAEVNALVVPVRFGGQYLGSLGVAGGAGLSDVVLQSISQVVAVALERARAEELADRAETARRNEQLKSTLLDAFAHEFKTPLTSIKAAATTVLSRRGLDDSEQDLLRVVDEEVDRLNTLVSEALELARFGSGTVKLHRGLHRIPDLVNAAIAPLRRAIENRPIQISIDGEMPEIELDSRLAELALRQLVDNALKYSTPSTPVEITALMGKDAVVVSVANTGPAIPQSERSLVFEKYYRGRQVRTRVPGSGMGLAIARDIIEAHGGRLWLSPATEGRVQFSFTLPILPMREHRTEEQTQSVA